MPRFRRPHPLRESMWAYLAWLARNAGEDLTRNMFRDAFGFAEKTWKACWREIRRAKIPAPVGGSTLPSRATKKVPAGRGRPQVPWRVNPERLVKFVREQVYIRPSTIRLQDFAAQARRQVHPEFIDERPLFLELADGPVLGEKPQEEMRRIRVAVKRLGPGPDPALLDLARESKVIELHGHIIKAGELMTQLKGRDAEWIIAFGPALRAPRDEARVKQVIGPLLARMKVDEARNEAEARGDR